MRLSQVLILSSALAMGSLASARTVQATLVGTLDFQQTYSVTCLATNCPPSQPYFEGVLHLENPAGKTQRIVLPEIQSSLGVRQTPSSINFRGQVLERGARLKISGTLDLDENNNYMAPIRNLSIIAPKLPILVESTTNSLYPQSQRGSVLMKRVTVWADGRIEKTEILVGEPIRTQLIKRLSPLELRNWTQLLLLSQRGQLINPNDGGVYCMALPAYENQVVALDGKVTLMMGSSPCGRTQINNTPQARLLLEELRKLE